jgi:hypothetical protein
MHGQIFDHYSTRLHQEKCQLPVVTFATAGWEIQGANVVDNSGNNEC